MSVFLSAHTFKNATFLLYKLDSTLKPPLHSYFASPVHAGLSNLAVSGFSEKVLANKNLVVQQ